MKKQFLLFIFIMLVAGLFVSCSSSEKDVELTSLFLSQKTMTIISNGSDSQVHQDSWTAAGLPKLTITEGSTSDSITYGGVTATLTK